MTTNKPDLNQEEDRAKILKEIADLEKDLGSFKESIAGYYNIPNKGEVGKDFTDMIETLEDIADTIEALPKKLSTNNEK